MSKFDSIRPYNDEEVSDILRELISNKDFIDIYFEANQSKFLQKLPFKYSLARLVLNNKIKNITNIHDYQTIFKNLVELMIDQTCNQINYEGIENILSDDAYLFISNHRDITLDSTLLNYYLHQNNFKTTLNAVGNNLMNHKWASDLMRLNKSFIIQRDSVSQREIYKSLNLASEFICKSIFDDNQSVWIAQRQGRAKDGMDITDPSVLKMIHLFYRKELTIDEFFNKLKIVPVAVSYEFDPNDQSKAQERYLLSKGNEYKKTDNEDLQSIINGVRGFKGNISLKIGSPLEVADNNYDDIASRIDGSIKKLYINHSTNYAACELLGIDYEKRSLNDEEILKAKIELKKRMEPLAKEAHNLLLDQYSNPVL